MNQIWNIKPQTQKTQHAELEPVTYSAGICVSVSRLQDAVNLVSLFHLIHPHSESALETARQQATGMDVLKVRAKNPCRGDI